MMEIFFKTMNKTSRRRFISDTGKAAMVGSLILAANNIQPREMKDIFVHHVYFWLKNAGNNFISVSLPAPTGM
jgi:hypothetical protein